MATALGDYRLREAVDWSPAEVRQFLEGILPGHPCIQCFTYTSGHVLCSLEKEDLRRQARSEEAANVIWTELRGCRGARLSPRSTAARADADGSPSGMVIVYVRTCRGVALEVEVNPSNTVASLKERIALMEGTPVESQRLIASGLCMQDARTLSSYDVRNASVLLLVPQLKDQTRPRPMTFAPRGLLMVPGNKPWLPAAIERPFLPVLCRDVSRGFPVSLEFASEAERQAFIDAAREEAPVLEIQPPRRGQLPWEIRASIDAEAAEVWLESSSACLSPSMSYQACVHFGCRGGQVGAILVTGAPVA